MVRADVQDKWGWPRESVSRTPQRLQLQEVLQEPQLVKHLFLPEEAVTWDEEALGSDDLHVVVGHIGDRAGWGTRVYKNCVPATKASSWGVAGRTHLVAQQWGGQWRARTLSVEEVKTIFSHDRVQIHLNEDAEVAMTSLGNSGPARMVLPEADRIVHFCKPQIPVVPRGVEEVISKDAVHAFRGAMHLTHQDFLRKVEQN